MSGDLAQSLKRAGEQVLGAKGLTGNDHVRLSALLKVAALEVEALRAAEGAARDDAAELRAVLAEVMRVIARHDDRGPHTLPSDVWNRARAALAATEGQP